MSTSTIVPVKEKISKKKCKKNNLKKCTSFKELNSLNTPTTIVTEYCVKWTEDANIIIRRNNKNLPGWIKIVINDNNAICEGCKRYNYKECFLSR